MGKGTFIKGFGTFTFNNVEYSLEGTTNQYERDIKIRRPVFLVSNEFVDYLKQGEYTNKSGIIYYTQKKTHSVPIVKINAALCSYGANISKEEFVTIYTTIIKQMGDEIRRGIFKEKIMPELGVILKRGNILGMRFFDEAFETNKLQTQKMSLLKKNLNLCMETKQSVGVRQRDLMDIDNAEREVRPSTAVVTKITKDGDKWMDSNLGIDVKKIPEGPREDTLISKPKFKKEYLLDQRYYRGYPKQNLGGLKISQEILEGIVKKKFLILREMKVYDTHGNGFISKFEFINAFKKANAHFRLGAELIEKIVNLYLGEESTQNTTSQNNTQNLPMTAPNVSSDKINYLSLMNAIDADIKNLINVEYANFPIEKYKGTIDEENKRSNSAYAFCRNSGNLKGTALNSKWNFGKCFNPTEEDIKRDVNRIKVVLNYLNRKGNQMISYLELISIFQAYSLSFSKLQMMNILKYIGIKNPNCFNINEFIYLIKKTSFIKPNYDVKLSEIKSGLEQIAEVLRMIGGEDYFFKEAEEINYDEFNERLKGHTHLTQKVLDAIYDYLTNKRKINLNKEIFRKHLVLEKYKNPYDENFDINSIKIITDKIYQLGLKSDSYFEHLLHYNICRYQNEINLEEFERLMEMEGYNFNKNEIDSIFRYIDFKKDNSIDREEWNKTMNKIPHPIVSIQNYIRNKKYDIETVAYKMDINLFDPNHEAVMNQKIPKAVFKNKMRQLNENLEVDYIYAIFHAIVGEKRDFITPKEIFEHFNIFKHDIYTGINVDEVVNRVKEIVQNSLPFDEFVSQMQKADFSITGRLPLEKFISLVQKLTNNKVNRMDLLRFSRIFHKLDLKDDIFYHELANILYEGAKVDNFQKCIQFLKKFLKEDCNNDLFLFFVKMNNMNNSAGMNKNINLNKLYEFFRGHVDMLHPSTINQFDLDGDGVVNFEDMTNIIKLYIDKSFFDDKKQIEEDKEQNRKNVAFEHFKKINTDMLGAINSINMTTAELFNFLDEDKDGFANKAEFTKQIQKLPMNKKLTPKEISDFYDYFDIYGNNQLDIQTFLNQIRRFKDPREVIYQGNFIIEFILLREFSRWYLKNDKLCDTEVFSILDYDHDGLISVSDLKTFALRTLLMSKNELNDMKIRRFMNAISLTKDGNLSLADIRNLLTKIQFNQLDEYYKSLKEMCNKGVSKYNKDPSWLGEVMERLGLFISEKYQNSGNFFNAVSEGKTEITQKMFQRFLDQNTKFLFGFNMKENEVKVLFSALSQNKNVIKASDLAKLFPIGKYDFYSNMHNDIYTFINQNFRNSRDAFKYFHRVQPEENYAPTTDKSSEIPAVTLKEFFRALNYLFPQKYTTESLLKYIKETFPNLESDSSLVSFTEFTAVYFDRLKENETFSKTFYKPSKILTDRQEVFLPLQTFNSPFYTKDHPKLKTPFDNDALNKVKKLILSSKTDYKQIFEEYFPKSRGGYVNQFELRNLIKKFDLGLTNIEIEDIINHSGISSFGPNGEINLYDFYYFLSNDDKNTIISRENVLNQLKEYKQLMYKYYTNPRLAFSLNDMEIKSTIDFDKFKKIILDIYKRDTKQPPNYAMLKYTYDFIDIRKDGVIDINEWNKIFATAEGSLDANCNKKQMNLLRKWETSNDIIGIYKLIARNKKIIRDKVKRMSLGGGSNGFGMVIQSNNLINILQDSLKGISLSQTQWKMLVAIGDRDKSGLIDFDAFMNVIDTSTKMIKSHPLPRFV